MKCSLILLLLFSSGTWAKSLSDYSPYEYEVRFTNPKCGPYKYDEPVQSRSGNWLLEKPENAYCRRKDAGRSGGQKNSPLTKLISWIEDPSTTEIFFTYLSFSNITVKNALCRAIEERDVKVTFVLDSGTGLKAANSLLECEASQEILNPKMVLRGHTPGIDYAHNKIFIVNPHSADEIKIAFGSGNMSSGIVLHHENWHFATTSPNSYFAQAHLCVANAEIHHADTGRAFRKYIKTCLREIDASPESDIRIFFVPGQGKEATEQIRKALQWSTEVKVAAHRFSYNRLIEMLEEGLKNKLFKLSLIFDDDLFWVGQTGGPKNRPNTRHEYRKAQGLIKLGAHARYIETNHRYSLLHHNKFIVFEAPDKKATFLGAGNFTGTAFSTNLENFYYVEIPEVTQAMSEQYEYLFYDLGTAEKDLPIVETAP